MADYDDDEMDTFINGISPTLTEWQRDQGKFEKMGGISGPWYHPAKKSRTNFDLMIATEAMDAYDIESLFLSGRASEGTLVLGE